MIEAVAIEGASSAQGSGAEMLDRPPGARRFYVERVEVHEPPGQRHTMRIVAGSAGSPLVDDVESVAAVLAQAVGGAETLIAQDARPAVAFVTQGIVTRAFGSIIRKQKLAFQNRCEDRAVRAVGT